MASGLAGYFNSALSTSCAGNLTTLLGSASSACNITSALKGTSVVAVLNDTALITSICSSSCASVIAPSSFAPVLSACANTPLFDSALANQALSGLLGPVDNVTAAALAADIGVLHSIACKNNVPNSCLFGATGLITNLTAKGLDASSLGALVTSFSTPTVLCSTSCGLPLINSVQSYVNSVIGSTTAANLATAFGLDVSLVNTFLGTDFTSIPSTTNCANAFPAVGNTTSPSSTTTTTSPTNKAAGIVAPMNLGWVVGMVSVAVAATIASMVMAI